MVTFDDEGFASIYLNSRLSYDKQRRSLIHELRHIYNDDAFNLISIRAAEQNAEVNDGKEKQSQQRHGVNPSASR